MAQTQTTSNSEQAERANRLYWQGKQTVEEIIDSLGISKSSLYASIRPISAGTTCRVCQERMVFTNRTNRSAGMATCRNCGLEQEVPTEQEKTAAAREAAPNGEEEGVRGWDRWREELTSVQPERAALIGGAAALGLMMGAAAVKVMRKMS